MRLLCVILAGLALLPLGCRTPISSSIASKGLNLYEFNTREQVHQEFGEPVSPGPSESPAFEEFRTRRKIADPLNATLMGLTSSMTAGLLEVVWVPTELCNNGIRLVAGQTIRFEYYPSGNVKRAYLTSGYFSRIMPSVKEDSNPEAEE